MLPLQVQYLLIIAYCTSTCCFFFLARGRRDATRRDAEWLQLFTVGLVTVTVVAGAVISKKNDNITTSSHSSVCAAQSLKLKSSILAVKSIT